MAEFIAQNIHSSGRFWVCHIGPGRFYVMRQDFDKSRRIKAFRAVGRFTEDDARKSAINLCNAESSSAVLNSRP